MIPFSDFSVKIKVRRAVYYWNWSW